MTLQDGSIALALPTVSDPIVKRMNWPWAERELHLTLRVLKYLRVASCNAYGLGEGGKRTEVVESLRRGKLDMLGVQDIHWQGCGVSECMRSNECEV